MKTIIVELLANLINSKRQLAKIENFCEGKDEAE